MKWDYLVKIWYEFKNQEWEEEPDEKFKTSRNAIAFVNEYMMNELSIWYKEHPELPAFISMCETTDDEILKVKLDYGNQKSLYCLVIPW